MMLCAPPLPLVLTLTHRKVYMLYIEEVKDELKEAIINRDNLNLKTKDVIDTLIAYDAILRAIHADTNLILDYCLDSKETSMSDYLHVLRAMKYDVDENEIYLN